MKRRLTLSFFITILIFSLALPQRTYAFPLINLDDSDEYSLYVDEYPGEVSNGIAAKFNKAKSNVDDYYLNLEAYDEDDFLSALLKGGIKLTEDQLVCAFTATLWYVDPEGEKDDAKKTDSVTVYCPIPDDAQEHPEDCSFYSVSSGKATPAKVTQYTDDLDVIYVKLEFPTYGTYGFVYNDPDSYEDDEDNEDSEDEDEEEADNGDYDDEEEEEDDNTTPTPTPAPKPTPVPNSSSEDEDEDYYDEYEEDDYGSEDEDEDYAEEDSENYDEWYYPDEEYYYDDPSHSGAGTSGSQSGSVLTTATPTPTRTGSTGSTSTDKGTEKYDTAGEAASGTKNSSSGSSTSASSAKDSIPRTGDDFPLRAVACTGVAAAVVLGAAIVLLIKKRG